MILGMKGSGSSGCIRTGSGLVSVRCKSGRSSKIKRKAERVFVSTLGKARNVLAYKLARGFKSGASSPSLPAILCEPHLVNLQPDIDPSIRHEDVQSPELFVRPLTQRHDTSKIHHVRIPNKEVDLMIRRERCEYLSTGIFTGIHSATDDDDGLWRQFGHMTGDFKSDSYTSELEAHRKRESGARKGG